jgi:hypothetical protein
MRISLRYGAAAGILAASFSMLGPAAQASQIPGTSVPATSHSSAAKTDVTRETTCSYQGVDYDTNAYVCVNNRMSFCEADGSWFPYSFPGSCVG